MASKVELIGTISQIAKDKIYIETKRRSGVVDTIPVISSDYCEGDVVKITGDYRSINTESRRLELFVWPHSIERAQGNANRIVIDGFICKPPTLRETPNGRLISDILVAVNRPDGSDYIPCICWGDNALFASRLAIGDHIYIDGRIQSRQYIKQEQERTAYEVSCNSISYH